MRRTFLLIPLLLALLAGLPSLGGEEASHAKYFQHYEGTKTCLKCHMKEAKAFFYSDHYQWKAKAPDVVNAHGQELGKINMINDFCTNPLPSWIGPEKNPQGKLIANGCSKCHAGLGKLPGKEPTAKELENIDCLVCHASGYRRDLYEDGRGGWTWKPILWKNREGLDSVAKRISLPKRAMCLRCHAASGGGPNWKRGDLEYALTDCEEDFDVHMATEGNDFACIDCHRGENHRIKGRGVDLAANDMPGERILCTDCHEERPHGIRVLDDHTKRIACNTCHIPTFANEDATDMERDWSKPVYHEDLGKWTATIRMESEVTPVYAWWNGKVRMQLAHQPVELQENGTIGMVVPLGSREDPNAKIYPFKLHRGRMPVLDGKEWLLPIKVEEFFARGDLDEAIRGGAREFYGIHDAKWHFVPTERYMGLFHEVAPADYALGCLDCHRQGGRIDWKALGYDGDPLERKLYGNEGGR